MNKEAVKKLNITIKIFMYLLIISAGFDALSILKELIIQDGISIVQYVLKCVECLLYTLLLAFIFYKVEVNEISE